MTGLSVDPMEPLNVENFGVGGPVWRHEKQQKSNKMAMILFYVRIHTFQIIHIVLTEDKKGKLLPQSLNGLEDEEKNLCYNENFNFFFFAS